MSGLEGIKSMSLVYVESQAAWGPVRIWTAADAGAMVRQATAPPAHIEDVGELDPERVAAAARVLLKPAGFYGWIDEHVKTAVAAVSKARDQVSVMPAWADEVDVRAIRVCLGMTQAAFAKEFGFPLTMLQGWEQGTSRPDGAALVLLRVIDRKPNAVREALAA